jgi:hypothetical protein
MKFEFDFDADQAVEQYCTSDCVVVLSIKCKCQRPAGREDVCESQYLIHI